MSDFGVGANFGEYGRPAHQVFEPGPGDIVVNGLLNGDLAIGGTYSLGEWTPGSQGVFFLPGTPVPIGAFGAEPIGPHPAQIAAMQRGAVSRASEPAVTGLMTVL